MIDTVLDALVRGNVAGSLAIAAVLAARGTMRRRFGAGAAYALWLAPLLVAAASLSPTPTLPAQPVGLSALPAVAAFEVGLDAAQPTFDLWGPSLIALWIAGALVTAVLFGLRQAAFLANVRRGQAGPALVGVLRPRVVTPDDFEAHYSEGERAMILAHEAAHLQRGDALTNAVVAIVQCACWFNPLVHLGARRLRIDQELACDEAVLRAQPEARKTYAATLLKTQTDGVDAPFVCAWPSAAPHPLKERIAMLKSPLPSNRRRALGLTAVGLASLTAAAGAWAAQADVAPTPKPVPAPVAIIHVAPQAADATAPALPAPKPATILVPKGKVLQMRVVDPAPATQARFAQPQVASGAVEDASLSVVIDPVWLEKPTGVDVAAVMPEAVRRQPGIEARAKMACTVARDGLLADCTMLDLYATADSVVTRRDDPPGWGLKDAMLQLSKKFRMAEKSRSGADTRGKTVVIPVIFRMTPTPVAPAAASNPAPMPAPVAASEA